MRRATAFALASSVFSAGPMGTARSADIPVVLEQHVDTWTRDKAAPLSGARIAWSKPLEALGGKAAVLYSMQAANPRPDVEIKTLDIVRAGTRATPAVLAVTTGTVISKKRPAPD